MPESSDGTAEDALSSLNEGDIIMFEFDQPVDSSNAAHCSIVRNGRIYQIVHWSIPSSMGQLDGPWDPSFFSRREP